MVLPGSKKARCFFTVPILLLGTDSVIGISPTPEPKPWYRNTHFYLPKIKTPALDAWDAFLNSIWEIKMNKHIKNMA